MENENLKERIATVLLIAAVVFLVFIIGVYVNLNLSDDQGLPKSEDKVEDLSTDDSSISDYFDGSFAESGDLGDSGSLDEGYCELDGQVMREGTVRFGTTCVSEPTSAE